MEHGLQVVQRLPDRRQGGGGLVRFGETIMKNEEAHCEVGEESVGSLFGESASDIDRLLDGGESVLAPSQVREAA